MKTDNPQSKRAYDRFVEDFPAYLNTTALDKLRQQEYSRLDRQDHVYLDYTGGSLAPDSLIQKHADLLKGTVFGNPHSANPTSQAMTDWVEKTRRHVLSYFKASPEEYVVIFTANASGALKLVGESYPFQPGDQYMLPYDNHNSVLGIREYDRARGAKTIYVPVVKPSMQVAEGDMDRFFKMAVPGKNNLFAFPAQSNFTGVQHPLSWISQAQSQGWDVILDAAAFVPTSSLDLSRVHPDFVTISFYKMFGYPTGVGALIARKEKLAKLHRPWFGGGTIVAVSVQANVHRMAQNEAGFEDGTPNYLSLPAVDMGLSFIEEIGIEKIKTRISCLGQWMIRELLALKHENGAPMVQIYGLAPPEKRGGTVAMNFFDAAGKPMDYRRIERDANRRNISIRTGCFCNPGTGEVAFDLKEGEITTCFIGASKYKSTDDFRNCFEDDAVVGAIRGSLGLASDFSDVYRFVEFAREYLT